MNEEIRDRCDHLLEIISEYSDCWSCGQVIKDKSLLVSDEYNPGRYRSVCPKCRQETIKTSFPPGELKHLFEMLIETAETNKPILVLVLSKTIFEVMIDWLLYRLMERRYTSGDICESVMERTTYQKKLGIITDITGKKLKELTKKAGYEGLMATLEELTKKRNAFLHDGIMTKPERDDSFKPLPMFRQKPLGDEDVLQAINFAIDTTDFFAKTFSDNGEYIPVFD